MPSVYQTLEEKYPSCCHKDELFEAEWEKVRHLAGDLAEFGVFNGNGARILARVAPDRTVYAYDTYDGMPPADYGGEEDKSDEPGKWKPTGSPYALFEGIPNICPVVGRFADSLPLVDADVRYILCHIDCDWYASHRQVFDHLNGHLTPGTILLLDDPQLPGARRAITEWVTEMNGRVTWDGLYRMVWNG